VPDRDSLLAAERELQRAQLHSDVDALDRVVHDDVELFIGPDTNLHGKAEDLRAHREHVFKFHESTELEVEANVFDTAGVTSALLALKVDVNGEPAEGTYRYVRFWIFEDDRWQIVGGAVVAIPG
jgi:ketosteroid isomerase-like protein